MKSLLNILLAIRSPWAFEFLNNSISLLIKRLIDEELVLIEEQGQGNVLGIKGPSDQIT